MVHDGTTPDLRLGKVCVIATRAGGLHRRIRIPFCRPMFDRNFPQRKSHEVKSGPVLLFTSIVIQNARGPEHAVFRMIAKTGSGPN
jgi:hypothetical protein